LVLTWQVKGTTKLDFDFGFDLAGFLLNLPGLVLTFT
jgi:hypothetical protein